MPQNRRTFLTTALSYSLAVGVLSHAQPSQALETPPSSSASDAFNNLLQRLFQGKAITHSTDILLALPPIAENGANVPLTVRSDLENIQTIWVLVEKNPTPLVAEFKLSSDVSVSLTARIKMAQSGDVWVIADDGSRLLGNKQYVEVRIGGCG